MLPAILLSVLVCQVLWFAGIHGALIVTGIMNPFWDGQPVGQSGGHGGRHRDPHLCPGLLGSLSADRRRRLHPAAGADAAAQQGRASADDWPDGGRAGGIDINEPILFGAPIIMNPLVFLPFVLVPMVNATLAYFALSWIVSRVVSMTPWTTPAPIGASWAANWSFSPVILCLICMATAMVMYLPFLKAYEKQLLAQERENAVGQADNAAQTA